MVTFWDLFIFTVEKSDCFFHFSKNGLYSFPWRCLQMTLKRSKVPATKTVTLTIKVDWPILPWLANTLRSAEMLKGLASERCSLI